MINGRITGRAGGWRRKGEGGENEEQVRIKSDPLLYRRRAMSCMGCVVCVVCNMCI